MATEASRLARHASDLHAARRLGVPVELLGDREIVKSVMNAEQAVKRLLIEGCALDWQTSSRLLELDPGLASNPHHDLLTLPTYPTTPKMFDGNATLVAGSPMPSQAHDVGMHHRFFHSWTANALPEQVPHVIEFENAKDRMSVVDVLAGVSKQDASSSYERASRMAHALKSVESDDPIIKDASSRRDTLADFATVLYPPTQSAMYTFDQGVKSAMQSLKAMPEGAKHIAVPAHEKLLFATLKRVMGLAALATMGITERVVDAVHLAWSLKKLSMCSSEETQSVVSELLSFCELVPNGDE